MLLVSIAAVTNYHSLQLNITHIYYLKFYGSQIQVYYGSTGFSLESDKAESKSP